MKTKLETNFENIKFSYTLNKDGYEYFWRGDEKIFCSWPNLFFVMHLTVYDEITKYRVKTRIILPLQTCWCSHGDRRRMVEEIIYKYIEFPENIRTNKDIEGYNKSIKALRNMINEWTENAEYKYN